MRSLNRDVKNFLRPSWKKYNLKNNQRKKPRKSKSNSFAFWVCAIVVFAKMTATVLGVVPLLQDVFRIGMAITITVGLAFGTVLTMLVVPVLYCIFYIVESPKPQLRWLLIVM